MTERQVSRPEGEYRWKHIAQAAEADREHIRGVSKEAFRVLCGGDDEQERIKNAIKILSSVLS